MPTKKAQTVDDAREHVVSISANFIVAPLGVTTPELIALIQSEVVTWDGSTVTWRIGHLEHVASLYVINPSLTEAVYHDDITVARAYSREQWEALMGAG